MKLVLLIRVFLNPMWRNHTRLLTHALSALHHGELSGTARRALEGHVARCGSCRDTLRGWDETEAQLRATQPAPIALPTDVAQSLFVRALVESGVQPDGRFHSRRRYWLAWTVGLTCLGVVAVLGLRQPPSQPAKPPHVASIHLPTPPTSQRSEWAETLIDPHFDEIMQPVLPLQTAAVQQTERFPLRRRHRSMRNVAVTRHRRRHRRPHSMPDLPPPPMLPQRDDAETMVAQATPETQEPQSSLLVVVTHEPALPVEVTHAPDDAPGYAAATCFRHNLDGAGIWHGCLVSKDEQGVDTTETQVAMATPGPQPEILVVQAATSVTDQSDRVKGRPELHTEEPQTDEPQIEKPEPDEPKTEEPKIEEPHSEEQSAVGHQKEQSP